MVKEVKRKAKIGDYIKILPNVDLSNLWGVDGGDIVYIDGDIQNPDIDGFIWGCGASYTEADGGIKYVVLDGYKLNCRGKK